MLRGRQWLTNGLRSDLRENALQRLNPRRQWESVAVNRAAQQPRERGRLFVTEDTDLGDVAALLEAKLIKRVPVMRNGNTCSQTNQVGNAGAATPRGIPL